MKTIKNILSIILVIAVVNTFATKAFHEYFEHKIGTHECENVNKVHFHQNELQHFDLICDFNIYTSLISDVSQDFKNQIKTFDNRLRIRLIHLLENLFHHHFLLRGPPTN